MADIIVSNPHMITSVDLVDHEIQFHDQFNLIMQGVDTVFIEVVSGTFKFNVGTTAASSGASYTAEKVGPISFQNGTMNIHYIATSAGTFRISF